ncbi:hypothetical protein [Burkholderia cenocepacia]|uniref:hypothetical protein n=1 Tax=Burkholderia cenocepacia TaxID=95486 RepID=UPI000762125C|nr:hypothetical protein [Burkholderia cenocepacia]KWU23394.1 hypothetical protein AS149_37025 [Burkholderia cenocepacia]
MNDHDAAEPTGPELQWGTTPFDALSPEELRRQCERLYAATESLSSLARQLRAGGESHPFWRDGLGARAIEEGEQALEAARQGYSSGDIYDSYFRYARDLLFVERNPNIAPGSRWAICSTCKRMAGSTQNSFEGKACAEVIGHRTQGLLCTGVLRHVVWDDLRPQVERS